MSEPVCPECQGEMVLREGRFGSFWGCRSYPTCAGSMNIHAAASAQPADKETKSARAKAVGEFTKFCASRGWTSAQGTKWICATMGLNKDESKITSFSPKQVELLLAYIKLESTAGGESEIALAMRKAQTRRKK